MLYVCYNCKEKFPRNGVKKFFWDLKQKVLLCKICAVINCGKIWREGE